MSARPRGDYDDGQHAADWYDEMRDAQRVKGRFRAIPATLPDSGRTDALAGWAVAPLFQAEPDRATTLAKLAGGFQRIVANAARETLVLNDDDFLSALTGVRTLEAIEVLASGTA